MDSPVHSEASLPSGHHAHTDGDRYTGSRENEGEQIFINDKYFNSSALLALLVYCNDSADSNNAVVLC